MAKSPVLGLVKTRLGRKIGPAQATRFFRANVQAVLDRLARDPRFETLLAVAPDARAMAHGFDPRLRRKPQGGGDLGDKMHRAAKRAPPGPVIIIGTDVPSIQPAHLANAFRLLGRNDVVIGPAEDGGFWLIGFRRFPTLPRCYANVRWSHSETLADVLKNLTGKRVAFIETLSDVDEPEDLIRLRAHIGRCVIGST